MTAFFFFFFRFVVEAPGAAQPPPPGRGGGVGSRSVSGECPLLYDASASTKASSSSRRAASRCGASASSKAFIILSFDEDASRERSTWEGDNGGGTGRDGDAGGVSGKPFRFFLYCFTQRLIFGTNWPTPHCLAGSWSIGKNLTFEISLRTRGWKSNATSTSNQNQHQNQTKINIKIRI